MSYIKIVGSGLIKLTGNYGYNTSTVDGLAAGTTIDATGASWIVSNSANQHPDADTSYSEGSGVINRFPFIVYSAGYGLTLKGGTIWGEVPQTSDWKYTYNDSAAMRLEEAPGVTVDSWRIDRAWDAIRIHNGSDDFLLNDLHLSNIRDDAVENEWVLSGTIRDSLFDGVFSALSLGNGDNHDGSHSTVTLENTFIRMESYLANGEMTHGSPLKANTDAPGTTPDIRIINSVIAIEDVTHNGFARLKLAWENVVESRGNVFLNLSDTPLPSNYPLPPEGFIILQGQAARDYWERVEKAWLNNHDGVGDVAVTPLPPLPGQGPVPTPEPASIRKDILNDFNGDGRDDILCRNEEGIVSNWLGQAQGSFASNVDDAYIELDFDWNLAGIGDFNGDGRDDLIWRTHSGALAEWLGQSDGGFKANTGANYSVSSNWHVVGAGDFNGDGCDDLLWRNNNGTVIDWLGRADGRFTSNTANTNLEVSSNWQVAGVGDFNGDGRDDVIWRNADGRMLEWLGKANGGFQSGAANYNVSLNWTILGIGDFNGDGYDDILWRNDKGTVIDWLGRADGRFTGNADDTNIDVSLDWSVAGVGDLNGDGRDDVLWRNDDGRMTDWLGAINGGFLDNPDSSYISLPAGWQIQAPELQWV